MYAQTLKGQKERGRGRAENAAHPMQQNRGERQVQAEEKVKRKPKQVFVSEINEHGERVEYFRDKTRKKKTTTMKKALILARETEENERNEDEEDEQNTASYQHRAIAYSIKEPLLVLNDALATDENPGGVGSKNESSSPWHVRANGRAVREYVDMEPCSEEVDHRVEQLISGLKELYLKRKNNPNKKQKHKNVTFKRYIFGLKEVHKHLEVENCKLVIVAVNV